MQVFDSRQKSLFACRLCGCGSFLVGRKGERQSFHSEDEVETCAHHWARQKENAHVELVEDRLNLDALRMGARIQVHLDTLTVVTGDRVQSQADEVEGEWGWKEEGGHAQVEGKTVM